MLSLSFLISQLGEKSLTISPVILSGPVLLFLNVLFWLIPALPSLRDLCPFGVIFLFTWPSSLNYFLHCSFLFLSRVYQHLLISILGWLPSFCADSLGKNTYGDGIPAFTRFVSYWFNNVLWYDGINILLYIITPSEWNNKCRKQRAVHQILEGSS